MIDVPTTPGPILPPPAGFLAARVLDDGQILGLVPLTFDRARLTLGPDFLYYPTAW